MKTHLLIGNRTACDNSLPRDAVLTINPAIVDCKLCRRTKMYKVASIPKPVTRRDRGEVQPELAFK